MNSQKFREEDLLDAIVVDQEGYICGRIANFSVESNQIIMNLYGYDKKIVETPDKDELFRTLVELIPKKGFFNRESTTQAIYDWVRDTLHLSKKEVITLEHLVEYAKLKRIFIPYKKQEVKVKTDKGSVDWFKVEKIAFTDLGKCVLLKEPVEAKRRGIPVEKEINYKSTQYLSGRLVIDSEAKIIGSAVKFLIGSPPGILINIERAIKTSQPDYNALISTLVPSKFKDSKDLFNQLKQDLNIGTATEDNLVDWAKKNKINVPMTVIERKEVIRELSIDWDRIAKIGDVVIFIEPVEELIAEEIQRSQTKKEKMKPNKEMSVTKKRDSYEKVIAGLLKRKK